MKINKIAIHVVQRHKDGEALTIKLRDSLNSVSGDTKVLAEGLSDLFSNATMNIGEFALDGDSSQSPPFENHLRNFYSDTAECSNFLALSQELAKRFKFILDKRKLHNVKGGYLVFFESEHRDDKFIAMAVLRKSSGVDISENLEVISAESIDLSKLHLGSSINLTKWLRGIDTRYIKFKVGTAKEVRGYFQEYVGCQRDQEAAVIETESLKEAITSFISNQLGLDKSYGVSKLENAHSYIKEVLKTEDRVLLSSVAKTLFPENDEEFIRFINSNYSIGEEILIDKDELKSYRVFSGKSDGISLSFPREMLQKEVVFENNQLIFKKIPSELKKELLKEVGEQHEPN